MAFDLSRWPHADALLDEALALPPNERRQFVRQSTTDEELASALERVLAEDEAADDFLPPAGALSGPLADQLRNEARHDSDPRLAPGASIGGYRIIEWLGRGGMGEVYRAADTSLGREVALKILPAEVADDPARLARFRREARLLASLNHPNIGAIYHVVDDGHVLALVLELIEGPTLAERLQAAPMPLADALVTARQIGEAIAAAHQAGVVHRDLKPANIKITPAGVVKVLDFGIAKAVSSDSGRTEVHVTLTDPLALGALGTAAYMSPEQARGETVDHRTDVWAFACVLYEMLTGRRAFEGQSTTEVIARVLERDPDFARLPAGSPEPLRRLLRRAFQKDPQQRLGYIGDALLDLDDALAAPEPDGLARAPREESLLRTWGLPLGGVAAGALLATALSRPAPAPPPAPISVAVPIPAAHEVVVGQLTALALSRDGRHLVYRAREDGVMRLYRRSLDAAEAVPLKGTEDAAGHALSPDGQFVAFARGSQLYKMPIIGGAPAVVGPLPGGAALSWGTPDTIVYSGGVGATLKRMSASGGEPETFTTLDPAQGELSHNWPELLPDGRTVLFTISATDGHHIAVTTLGAKGPPTRLTAGRQPRLLGSGLLIFARDRGLWTARFDPETRTLLSEPQSAIDGVDRSGFNGFVHFDASDNGDLIYIPFRERAGMRVLDWVDRAGRPLGTELERRGITRFALSPDGTHLAVSTADGDDRDIWVVDRQRGGTTRLTSERGTETQPVWSPDGRFIAYRADRDGGGVFVRAADGASPPRRLTTAGDAVDIPYTFTRDGAHVLFTRFRDYADQDVLSVSLEGGAIESVLTETHAEMRPALSPDGRWLLYQSDQSGRLEVYLRPFPDVRSARWPVSTGGGTSAAWSTDGRELYFVEGTTLQAVSFAPGPTPRLGRPRPLLDLGPSEDRLGSEFDLSPDGSRILLMRDAPGNAERADVRLVLHWAATR